MRAVGCCTPVDCSHSKEERGECVLVDWTWGFARHGYAGGEPALHGVVYTSWHCLYPTVLLGLRVLAKSCDPLMSASHRCLVRSSLACFARTMLTRLQLPST